MKVCFLARGWLWKKGWDCEVVANRIFTYTITIVRVYEVVVHVHKRSFGKGIRPPLFNFFFCKQVHLQVERVIIHSYKCEWVRPWKHEVRKKKGKGTEGGRRSTSRKIVRTIKEEIVEGKNWKCRIKEPRKGLLLRCACSPLWWRLLRNEFRKHVTPFFFLFLLLMFFFSISSFRVVVMRVNVCDRIARWRYLQQGNLFLLRLRHRRFTKEESRTFLRTLVSCFQQYILWLEVERERSFCVMKFHLAEVFLALSISLSVLEFDALEYFLKMPVYFQYSALEQFLNKLENIRSLFHFFTNLSAK